MLDPALVAEVNEVRERFVRVVGDLGAVPSFRALVAGSATSRALWEASRRVADSPRVRGPASPCFTCAFVGSSGHGKTTILAEMFPDLERRGWLRTDLTDTTSQALVIRLAAVNTNDADRVAVRSWGLDEIRRLVDAAKAENARDNIAVRYHDDRVEIDGTAARLPDDEKRRFKFAPCQELRPLPAEFVLSAAQVNDPAFINALTTKETSERVRRGPVLTVGGRAFEPLPLRAAVKEVELHEPFANVLRWARPHAQQALDLVFIDTPGLNVAGTAKDEVLRHVLSKKNQQIVVELIRRDELDLVVHLVLNGGQSAFSQLWSAVAEQCSPDDLADLEERLVLAINGVNRYFTNDDLTRKWKSDEAARLEGDHFAVTIEDNILNRISDRGRVRPAKVAFLDSKRIVANYAETYAGYRGRLESWCEPGTPAHETLRRLGLVEALRRSIGPLCDPEDRGQGHLVRLILELLREKGSRLFTRKHLIRNGLLATIQKLREGLRRDYDDSGALNLQAVRKAVRQFLAGIDPARPYDVERFARQKLDPLVAKAVPELDAPPGKENWVNTCFNKFASLLYKALKERVPQAPAESANLMGTYLQARVNHWRQAWGYAAARMPPPTTKEPQSADLVRHALRYHAREMVYQLATDQGDGAAEVPQRPDDREAMRGVLETLARLEQRANDLCRRHGVTSHE